MKVSKTEIIESLKVCATEDGCKGCAFRHKSENCHKKLLNSTIELLENNIIEVGNGQNYTTVQEIETV